MKFFDTVMNTLKQSFPNLNWKMGSMLRTLIAAPLEVLGQSIDTFVASISAYGELRTALNAPYEYPTVIDHWFTQLGLTLPEATSSHGVVRIVCTSPDALNIPAGTEFTWGDDVVVRVSESVALVSNDPRYTILQGILFYVDINAEAADLAASSTLTQGTVLNWRYAPTTVSDIFVEQAVQGGFQPDTGTKAAMISAALATPSACGEEGIRAALIRKYPDEVTDVRLAPRQDTANPHIPIYIKPTTAPGIRAIQVSGKTVEPGIVELSLNASGILRIGEIRNSVGLACRMISEQTLDDNIILTVESAYEDTDYTVEVLSLPIYAEIAEWMNSRQAGAPVQIIPTMPLFAEVSMQIDTGGVDLSLAARTALCDYVNHSGFDTTLTDTGIRTVLAAYGYATVGKVLITASATAGGRVFNTSGTSGLTLNAGLTAGGTPIAAYCSLNNISWY